MSKGRKEITLPLLVLKRVGIYSELMNRNSLTVIGQAICFLFFLIKIDIGVAALFSPMNFHY